MFITVTLSLIATASVAYCAVTFGMLHLLDPATDAVGRASSEYVLGPYGYLMTSVYLIFALALTLIAIATVRIAQKRIPCVPFLIASGALGVSSVYPTDRGLTPTTATGAVHNVAGLLAFLSIVVGAVWLTRVLGRSTTLAGRTVALKIFATATAIAFVLTFLAGGPLAVWGLFGVAQRATIAASLAWVFTAGVLIALATRAHRLAPAEGTVGLRLSPGGDSNP